MYSLRSPPPFIDTDKCRIPPSPVSPDVCLPPHPRGTRARVCLSSTSLRSVRLLRRPCQLLLRLQLVDSAWSVLEGLRIHGQPGRCTLYRSCGPEPSNTTCVTVGLDDHLYKWEGGENAGGGGRARGYSGFTQIL